MDSMPRVSIIILNWNGWKDTIECLESVYQVTYPTYDLIVIDNGSRDDSIENIKKYAEGKLEITSKYFKYSYANKPIHYVEYLQEAVENSRGEEEDISDIPSNRRLILIKNKENYGFAEGNNIGMRYALENLNPAYIILLNNDTVVKQDFLYELVKVAEGNKDIGIISPKVLKWHNPKIIDSTGHIFRWGMIVDRGVEEEDFGQYDDKNEIIGSIAAATLYRANMLKEIGLFDKTFITMYEDAELSWRAYKKGWRAWHVPTSIVYHKRGASINKSEVISEKIKKYCVRNVITTVKKHATPCQKIQFTLLWITSYMLNLIGLRKSDIDIMPYLSALIRLYR